MKKYKIESDYGVYIATVENKKELIPILLDGCTLTEIC